MFKEKYDEQILDSALSKLIQSKPENMEIHFIYAGHYYKQKWFSLESMIKRGLKKYKIKNVMLTKYYMRRERLITAEDVGVYYGYTKYKCPFRNRTHEIGGQKLSVNDDLDSFFEPRLPNCLGWIYFFPKLTTQELKLVERKDPNFMNTFYMGMSGDANEADMKRSESDSKYVYAFGSRNTNIIENSLKRKKSSSFLQ